MSFVTGKAKPLHFNAVLHALAWSIVIFLPYMVAEANDGYKIGPLPGLYFTLSGFIHAFIFYGNALWLYPKLFNRAYWLLYGASVIILIILSVSVKLYILSEWFPDDLQAARSHVLFPSLVAFIVSVFYGIAIEKFDAEKKQKENEAARLATEVKFLRSQISPHFVFNILTNLVSLARKKSADLETALIKLSSLMRYMLYDAEKKISLQEEVEYLESYVALQQLRFGADVKTVFTVEISDKEEKLGIEPMILIPFVENAFKHGTGTADQPVIEIHLKVRQHELFFHVKNKFDPGTENCKEESSGIGLNNVSKRLKLLYPGRHDLIIHHYKSLFSVSLNMKLL